MRPYLEERLQIAREHGGEGLIAELVRVEKEGGRISGEDMVAMVFLLLGAGSETTTHLISGSLFELLKNPSLRDWLDQGWARANLAVEEFLRFVSPVQFSKPRYVRKDFRLDGVELKKGDKRRPTPTPGPTRRLKSSISRGTRTAMSPSALASISASAFSSRG